jgi:hypoxanthine-DNA glycosylase
MGVKMPAKISDKKTDRQPAKTPEPGGTDNWAGGFAPVLDCASEILILGSFPGVASLAAQQYYAHPRNQFWPLLSRLLGEDLVALAYPQRLPRLLAHRIGVWDVLGACSRSGSLDSAIRQAQANDFSHLRQEYPALHRIGFNGKTSGKFAPQFAALGFETIVLPSSSPAYAQRSFEQKLQEWMRLLAD